MKIDRLPFFALIGLVLATGALQPGTSDAMARPQENDAKSAKVSVERDGELIVFPDSYPALGNIQSSPVTASATTLSMTAPGRIVASTVSAANSTGHSTIFESSELATLYSEFQQSGSSFDRATKNLVRTKSMFESEAATSREMTDAENDLASSKAQLNASESKLRAIGLDPKELEATSGNMIWLISDVPESQLHEVEQGETVRATFSSFPGMVVDGKADAIGDAVDPILRTVRVRAKFKNDKGLLRPGMFARIDFGAIHNAAIVIPITSVVRSEGKDYVFIERTKGHFERQSITLLETGSEKDAIVLNGIKATDNVVSKGAMLLKGLSFGF